MILGLLGAGAVGIVLGNRVPDGLSRVVAPVAEHDPTGLLDLVPLGNTFRYYSVTGSVRSETAATYRLAVSGLVAHPGSHSLADLQAMPRTELVQDFQCVTGWRVPGVRWAGVRLSELLDRAGPTPAATAVRFTSFDGTYTESLPLTRARGADVVVAVEMLGKPVTHEHGGPVRMYVGGMYGYKSTKWLSGVELTDRQLPGYWETRGYDVDGTIRD